MRDVGIVFALPVEADAFARSASDAVGYEAAGTTIHEGIVGGRRVAWCAAGVGAAAATRATRLLIDGHRPARLVSAGFAGGLAPALDRGAVVLPTRVLDGVDGGPPIALAHAALRGIGATATAIVSVARVVTTAAAKRALAAETGAEVVDMETYAVARAAGDASLPCTSIRVVSDTAGQDLPREIGALVQPQSGMRRLGAALAAIGRRPGAALDMWQLWEHAVVDGRTLAAAITRWLEQFSPDR
jgi:adenosylhomocysteine nucleosidase